MRHGDKVNNLGRTASHRRALLANMAVSLIEHKRITTTLAKAKALRKYMEPLVTKAKSNTTHSRRVVFSYLHNKEAIKELFSTVAEKVGDRPGGYLRVIKLGFRRGDGAETAMIEFVDFNEVYNPNAGKVRTKTKRTRRGGKKAVSAAETAAAPVAEAVAAAEVVEAVADEPVVEEVAAQADEAVEQVEEVVAQVETAAAEAEETVAEAADEVVAEAETAAEEATEEEKKDEEQA
jgi:large subunit ribosomal protein L17